MILGRQVKLRKGGLWHLFALNFMDDILLKTCFTNTLKCLSIGTPKIINFPFVSNGKVMIFRCPNIPAHCNETVLCLNFGTP